MSQNSDSFFGSGKDFGLHADEKVAVWQALQKHMETHAASVPAVTAGEEQEMREIFACAAAVTLASEERVEIAKQLSAQKEALEYFQPACAMALTTEEHADAYAILRDRMALMPIQQADSFWSSLRTLVASRLLAPGLAAVLLVSAGAGITYAADSALPGDFLYPLKRVQEQIRTGLQFSHESKAEAETDRLGRRVQEAQVLQESKRLSTDVSSSLDTEFRLERRRAVMQIQLLEQDGNVDAAARIRSRLNGLDATYNHLLGASSSSADGTTEHVNAAAIDASSSSAAEHSSAQEQSSQASSTAASSFSNEVSSSHIEKNLKTIIKVEVHGNAGDESSSVFSAGSTSSSLDASDGTSDVHIEKTVETTGNASVDIHVDAQNSISIHQGN